MTGKFIQLFETDQITVKNENSLNQLGRIIERVVKLEHGNPDKKVLYLTFALKEGLETGKWMVDFEFHLERIKCIETTVLSLSKNPDLPKLLKETKVNFFQYGKDIYVEKTKWLNILKTNIFNTVSYHLQSKYRFTSMISFNENTLHIDLAGHYCDLKLTGCFRTLKDLQTQLSESLVEQEYFEDDEDEDEDE